ncbi:UNVERIFIED_CONTAM: hypothetical protein RMT77_000933 [Armadillidium vulgare]|nr:hypothetical protein Avbf_00789 [Armadillidium vulgare]
MVFKMSSYPRIIDSLTDFSDDILLHIFSYLSGWDLINVMETCHRLSKVGKDHSLWKKADFSDGMLTASLISKKVFPCLHESTKSLHIRGYRNNLSSGAKRKSDLLTTHILKTFSLKCPNLEELHVLEAIVNAERLKLRNFGELKNITHFRISNCEFISLPSPVREGSYFSNMSCFFQKIENLEISFCNWITDYDLMVLSKLDTLKSLCLKCDLKIGYTIVYLSISFRFGFKNLESLDLRGTSLRDNDVSSIMLSGKLKSLSIGPIGCVRRFSDSIDDGLNLIIPDPFRKEEPPQQVVVINMGPNGPNWRHADEEELDTLGLHWVKKGLNRNREAALKEDEHYFFCKEGKLIRARQQNKTGEFSQTQNKNSNKRKETECCEPEKASKRLKSEEENISNEELSSDEEREETGEKYSNDNFVESSINCKESTLPDSFLSDSMVHGFRDHSNNLEHLILAGCAITNNGLFDLLQYTLSLKYLDISDTYVTNEGLLEAQTLLPNCKFVLNKVQTPESR